MTPEEKAIELVNKMYRCADPLYKYPMCRDTAIQTSLILINEILESFLVNIPEHQIKYWENVKQEIIKL